MSVLAPGQRMAKRRNDVSVKVDAESVRIAKIVAAYRDKSLAEYLSEIVLAQATSDLAQEQATHSATGETKRKGGKT